MGGLVPATLGGRAQTPQSGDDGLVFLEHRRPIGLEALGQRQQLGHLGRCRDAWQWGERPQGRQGNLLFHYEVRAHQPGQGLRGFADLAVGLGNRSTRGAPTVPSLRPPSVE
jgi:hypothetical protein